MRLIDADELMEHVWRERLDSRERIADLVRRMRTVEHWIPISKRMPEDYEPVLVTCDYGNRKEVFPDARYSKKHGWEWVYEAGADYYEPLRWVVAWMPQPEPYEGKNDAGNS